MRNILVNVTAAIATVLLVAAPAAAQCVDKGGRGTGVCCLNGPAARKGAEGDIVIVISYALIYLAEAKAFKPVIVFPKAGNKL